MDRKKAEKLARLIHYVIGRRPDEFGLVADVQGFIPVSDVLTVIHGEGWSKVRRFHLETLNYLLANPTIEIKAHLLRARDRSRLDGLRDTAAPPKLLYAPIRRRAYESVLQHGLRPQGHTGQVVLFADQGLAQKVGQRRDAEPVIVTVNVDKALGHGCLLRQFGEHIFLTEKLPPECCRLPRPPKAIRPRNLDPPPPAPSPKTPGSFILTIDPLEDQAPARRSGDRKYGSKDWQKERRKARRWKENRDKPR